MKTIAIYLTGACNLRCKHCSVGLDQYKLRPALSSENIKTILLRAKERGVEYITLLGGEPTYSDHDLPEIFAYAEKIDIKISINTNLSFFEKIENILIYKSLKNIVISVDGSSIETHNKMRGLGHFEKLQVNLKKLIEFKKKFRQDIIVDITFTLTDINKYDSISIFKFAEKFNVDGLNINIVQISGRAKKFNNTVKGDSSEYIQSLAKGILYYLMNKPSYKLSIPLPPAVAMYLEQRYGIPSKIFINSNLCGGTSVYTYVDLRGNLLPCPGMSYEESNNKVMDTLQKDLNVLNHPIKKIEGNSVFTKFESQRIEKSKNILFEPCNTCKFIKECSPCTSSIYKSDQENEILLCQRVKELCDKEEMNFNLFNKS